jgi:hypothetical protein
MTLIAVSIWLAITVIRSPGYLDFDPRGFPNDHDLKVMLLMLSGILFGAGCLAPFNRALWGAVIGLLFGIVFLVIGPHFM